MLEVRHLEVGYPEAVPGFFAAARVLPIVRDVSFTLTAGRTVGVVGGKRLWQVDPWPGADPADQAHIGSGSVAGRGFGQPDSAGAAP